MKNIASSKSYGYVVLAFAAFATLASWCDTFKLDAVSPRRIVIGDKPAIALCENGKASFEVVRPVNSAAFKAASELIERLHQITGLKVSMVAKASGKVPAFYLGVCPEATALGLTPEKLDRDGFYIKTDGNRIFITGCDSNNPKKKEHASLFGVYEFLERFGGVRYYFPGEIGTIVPKKETWTLPDIDITERPDTQYRWIYCTRWSNLDSPVKYAYPGLTNYNPSTWRNSTLTSIRSCHGLNDLRLVERFAKTNPEFFAMTENGKRHDGSWNTLAYHKLGHLCYSSKELKEVIYQDVVACLTGKPASSRGLKHWTQRWNGYHVDLAPNDGMMWCLCPECKKIKEQGPQAMSDHIWGFASEIGERLKKDGIPGYVMMDSYSYWRQPPSFKMPDNVMVGVTVTGPWATGKESTFAANNKTIRDYSKIAQGKIKAWVYPTKAGAMVASVPNFTPYAVEKFFKANKDYLFGSFFEAESDCWMFGFMNCYVFSKVMWNYETDVDALIDEHCQLMFGSAAKQMKKFYLILEDIWMHNIVSKEINTSRGVVSRTPTRREVWTTIFNEKRLAEVNALLASAEAAIAKEPDSLKRFKFIKEQLWQPVLDASEAYKSEANDRTAWTIVASEAGNIALDGNFDEEAWKKAVPVWLQANKSTEKAEVHTRVKMLQDKDYFYFGFEADEPETDKMNVQMDRSPDNIDAWLDNGGEIFLSAEPASDFIYQFIFNSSGFKADLKSSPAKEGPSYNSGFDVKTQCIPGKKWTAEVRIPRSSMPELAGRKSLMANFTRHRVLNGVKIGTAFYSWHPKQRNIAENCGIVQLEAVEGPTNLVNAGDCDVAVIKERYMGRNGWAAVGNSKHLIVDQEVFVTKGKSLRMDETCTRIRQNLPLQPDRTYKFSFFVKTEDLQPGLSIIVRFGGDPAPAKYLLGDYKSTIGETVNWNRVEKTFKAPKVFGKSFSPMVEFMIGKNTGKCWIDHVELLEIDN